MSTVTGATRTRRLAAAEIALVAAALVASCGPAASTSSASPPAAVTSSNAPLPTSSVSPYPAQPQAQLATCAKNTSQPGASVDGNVSNVAAMCQRVATVNQDFLVAATDPNLEHAAVAWYVLEVLLYPEAAHDGINVTDAQVHRAVQQQVDNYNLDPAAGQRAGIIIPAGETAEEYFFEPSRVAEYRRLLIIGAERNHVEGYGSESDRLKSAATWLVQAMTRHTVVVLNIAAFDLPSALDWLAQQPPRPVTPPPATPCINVSPVPAPTASSSPLGVATPIAGVCFSSP